MLQTIVIVWCVYVTHFIITVVVSTLELMFFLTFLNNFVVCTCRF